MAKKTYAEKLKDPRWQKKRLEVLGDANFTCEVCHDNESPLHVHHKFYLKNREIWEYDREQLACLCESCHTNQHEEDARLKELISCIPIAGPGNKDEIFYLLCGFLGFDDVEFKFDYQKRLYDCGNEASGHWRYQK